MGTINGILHKSKRRYLRKSQTLEEAFVWKMLRGKKTGIKWRRQVSIGNYVADFYCTSKKLILELDGNHHHEMNNREYDDIRTRFFSNEGIKVIRITNSELKYDPTIVYRRIGNHSA